MTMKLAAFRPRGTTDDTVLAVDGLVIVLRPLTAVEADLDETGPMFRVRSLLGGRETDAFIDELTEIQ